LRKAVEFSPSLAEKLCVTFRDCFSVIARAELPSIGGFLGWGVLAMEANDRTRTNTDLRPRARRYAVHEAGHAVVAHRLNAHVLSVEIDSCTFDEEIGTKCIPMANILVDIAVTVAGCGAEHLLGARTRRRAKRGDRRRLRQVLATISGEAERAGALALGFRLAEDKLTAHQDDVRKVADELLRRWSLAHRTARISRDELIALLDG
jgi:hypothetical protein